MRRFVPKAKSFLYITQHRSIVHAFCRPPTPSMIPPTSDQPTVHSELHDFYLSLKFSGIVDSVHIMSEFTYLDSIRTQDTMITHAGALYPVPRYGIEHRVAEFNDSLRYLKGHGGTLQTVTALQENDGARACAGDFIMTHFGCVAALSSRTNRIAVNAMRRALQGGNDNLGTTEGHILIEVELEDDAPPLSNFFYLCGNDVLIAWKDRNGMHAVKKYQEVRKEQVHMVVFVEPGCNLFSLSNAIKMGKVVVESGMTKSIEALESAGLQPIVTPWKEMKSLGFSMMSTCLIVKFDRGGYSPHEEKMEYDMQGGRRGRWADQSSDPTMKRGTTDTNQDPVPQPVSDGGRWRYQDPPDKPFTMAPPRYRAPMRRIPSGLMKSPRK